MPRTIKIDPLYIDKLGYSSITVDDNVTDSEIQSFLNSQLQPPVEEEPPQDTGLPRQEGAGVISNVAGGVLRGLAQIGETTHFVGEKLGIPGSAESRQLLSRLGEEVAPVTPLGEYPLADIVEQEGLGAAIAEQARRLPGQIGEQVPFTLATLVPGALGVQIAKKAGYGIVGQRILGAVGAGAASTIEGLEVAEEIEAQGGDTADQVAGFMASSSVIAALNVTGLGVAFKPLLKGAQKQVAKSFLGKLTHVLASAGTEGATEWLEEPAQLGVLAALGFDPGDVSAKLKAGLDVLPVSVLLGGVFSTAAQVVENKQTLTPQTRQDFIDRINTESDKLTVPNEYANATLPESDITAITEAVKGDSDIAKAVTAYATRIVVNNAARHKMSFQDYYNNTFPYGMFRYIDKISKRKYKGLTDIEALATKPNFNVAEGQLRAEMSEVQLEYDAKGRILAPNGKVSKLNETDARIVRTPTFRQWFKSSHVIDKNKDPVLVSHGTRDSFTRFRIPAHFGTYMSAVDRLADTRGTAISFGSATPKIMEIANSLGFKIGLTSELRIVPIHYLNNVDETIKNKYIKFAQKYGVPYDREGLGDTVNPYSIDVNLIEQALSFYVPKDMVVEGNMIKGGKDRVYVSFRPSQPAKVSIHGPTTFHMPMPSISYQKLPKGELRDLIKDAISLYTTIIGSPKIRELLGNVMMSENIVQGFLSLNNPMFVSDSEANIANIFIATLRRYLEPVLDPYKRLDEYNKDILSVYRNIRSGMAPALKVDHIGPLVELVRQHDSDIGNSLKVNMVTITQRLKDIGIDGFIYRNDVEHPGSTSYVAFSPEQFKSKHSKAFDSNSTDYLDQLMAGAGRSGVVRGVITFYDENNKQVEYDKAMRYFIRLFKGATTSTVMHELFHYAALSATGEVKASIEKVYGKPIEKWTIKDHERFARTGEAWLYNGKTKIPELAGAFTVIRSSMRKLYKSVRSILKSDPRYDLNYSSNVAIRHRDLKYQIFDMLFEKGAWGDEAPVQLQQYTNFMDFILGHVDTADDDTTINQIIANNFRVNGVNLKSMLATLPWDKVEKYVVPLIREMGRSNAGEPVSWEATILEATNLVEKDPDFMVKIQKNVASGRLLQPHEILAMQMVGSLLAGSYVKVLTKKGATAAEKKDMLDAFRAIIRTTQDAASPIGRALNSFKIFHSVNELVANLSIVKDELTAQELDELMSLDLTDVEAMEAMIEKFKQKGRMGGVITQALMAIWYNSMLFNPGTITLNTLGNTMHTMYLSLTKEAAAVVDSVFSKITGRPRTTYAGEGLQVLRAMAGGLAFQNERARQEFMAALRGNLEGTAATTMDDKVSSHTIRAFETLFEQYNVPHRDTKAMKLFAGLMVGGQRSLVAMDLWFKAIVREAYLGEIGIIATRAKKLASKVNSKYLTDDSLKFITKEMAESQFIADELWLNQSHDVRKQVRAWEKSYKNDHGRFPNATERIEFMEQLVNFKDIPRVTEIKKRAADKLIEAKEKELNRELTKQERKKIVDGISQHFVRLEAAVERIEAYYTFQDMPNKFVKSLINARDAFSINIGGTKIPVGRILVPFMSTLMNITIRSTELVPGIGAVVGLASKTTPMEVVVKQLQGIAMFLIIGKMLEAGLVTGPPPDDPEEREAFYESGKLPYSFVLPDGLHVEFRRGDPFSLMLSMSVTFYDALRKIEESKDNPEEKQAAMLDGLISFMAAISDEFYNSTWFNNMQLFSSDEYDIKQRMTRTVSSLVPFSSMQRRIYQSYLVYSEGGVPIADRPSFAEAFWGNFWNAPPARLDIFGEEVRKNPELPAAWIPPDTELARITNATLAFLSPVNVSAEQMDDVEAELMRLELYPAMPGRKLKIPGDDKPSTLTDEVYNEYVVRSGSKFKARVRELIHSAGYAQASDEVRYKMIDNIHKAILNTERARARNREFTIRNNAAKLPSNFGDATSEMLLGTP